MARTIVDFHVVQTVPPSNINRDDTGAPKTATYGGVRRARVSSQAWKRATRDAFGPLLDAAELGVRTKRVVELVATRIAEHAPDLAERSRELAEAALNAAGITTKEPRKKKDKPELANESGYLLFLSSRQVDNLARLAAEAARAAGDGKVAIDKKEAKARANRDHSVDVSLFGRMVADDAELNVDAAAQVAHALSVHEVSNEYDYYTAVDDHKKAAEEEEDAGAGMIGTIEYNSSTLYRYATVDVDRLRDNLGDAEATRRAVEAFARAFVTSMPTGKQNTFANRTLPDAVVAVVRQTQSINLVGAYEEPVGPDGKDGRIPASIHRLVAHGTRLCEAFDETPVAGWTIGVGELSAPLAALGTPTTMDGLVRELGTTVAGRLS